MFYMFLPFLVKQMIESTIYILSLWLEPLDSTWQKHDLYSSVRERMSLKETYKYIFGTTFPLECLYIEFSDLIFNKSSSQSVQGFPWAG